MAKDEVDKLGDTLVNSKTMPEVENMPDLEKLARNSLGIFTSDPLFSNFKCDGIVTNLEDLDDDELVSELELLFPKLETLLDAFRTTETELDQQQHYVKDQLSQVRETGVEQNLSLFNEFCSLDSKVDETKERATQLLVVIKTLLERLGPRADEYQRLVSAQSYVKLLAKVTKVAEGLDRDSSSKHFLKMTEMLDQVSEYQQLTNFVRTKIGNASAKVLSAVQSNIKTSSRSSGWPQEFLTPGVQHNKDTNSLARDFGDMLDVEFALRLISKDGDTYKLPLSRPVVVDDADTTDGVNSKREVVSDLQAIEALVTPLIQRFRYHFCGTKNTNRVDKPEFYLRFITQFLQASAPFVVSKLQPEAETATMTRWARGAIMNELSQSAGALLNHGSCSVVLDTTSHIVRALVRQVHKKVLMDSKTFLKEPALLCHLVDELCSTDSLLCGEFCYAGNSIILDRQVALDWPVTITVLCDNENETKDDKLGSPQKVRLFDAWLKADLESSQKRLAEVLTRDNCWNSLDQHVRDVVGVESAANKIATVSSSTPESCSQLLDLIDTIRNRFKYASNDDCFRCATEIITPLLQQYLTAIEITAQRHVASLDHLCSAINGAFIVMVTVQGWLDSDPQFVRWERLFLQHLDRTTAEQDMKRRDSSLLEVVRNGAEIGKKMGHKIQGATDGVKSDMAKATGKVTSVMTGGVGIGSTALFRSLGVTSVVSRALQASKTLVTTENQSSSKEVKQTETLKPKRIRKTMFGDVMNRYNIVLEKLVSEYVVGGTLSEVQNDLVTYLNKVKAWNTRSQLGDQRIEIPSVPSHDFQSMVVRLSLQLSVLRGRCHPVLQHEIVKSIALGMSNLFVNRIIRGYQFSYIGSLQVAVDIRSGINTFLPWSKKPENAYFRKVTESLSVLTMQLPSLVSLCDSLLQLGGGRSRQLDQTAKASIQDMLEQGQGWWMLSADDVLSLSEQRVDFLQHRSLHR